MIRTKMDNLIREFQDAVGSQSKFIAVAVRIGDMKTKEVIINSVDSAEEKLEYYVKTYDQNLKHRFADVEIVDCAFGNDFFDLQARLEI
ncbi:hypothetical protein ACQKJG_18405 [Priestia megaterium]|uniref:hypothetical protein n=1 Tax=Priestia megaterium TaxID=1404 RepID=UPI003CFDE441